MRGGGAAGALAVVSRTRIRASAPDLQARDTTGAGDAFTGALASSSHSGVSWIHAIAMAVAAGTLAFATVGAQFALRAADAINRLASTVESGLVSHLLDRTHMTHRTFHGFFRMFLVCALGASMLQAAPARAEDYSDIWWAGPVGRRLGRKPHPVARTSSSRRSSFTARAPSTTEYWYVATLARAAGGAFTGDLYQTTGTGIGAPWNPAAGGANQGRHRDVHARRLDVGKPRLQRWRGRGLEVDRAADAHGDCAWRPILRDRGGRALRMPDAREQRDGVDGFRRLVAQNTSGEFPARLHLRGQRELHIRRHLQPAGAVVPRPERPTSARPGRRQRSTRRPRSTR